MKIGVGKAGNVIGGGDWAQDRIVVDCVRAWNAGEKVIREVLKRQDHGSTCTEPLSGYLAFGQQVTERRVIWRAFNFGPRAEQNRTT